MRRHLATLTSACLLIVATPAVASPISAPYAKKVIRHYIEDEYTVAQGPNFGPCKRLASNWIRCEVEFKAGLYWRCGRVSVKNSRGIDHITARLPIGC